MNPPRLVIDWYIPKQVVYFGWPRDVTLETVRQVSLLGGVLMDQGAGTVHILNDARAVRTYPLNVMEIREAMTFLDHPQLEWLVSITPGGLVTFLAEVVPQIVTNTKARAYTDLQKGLSHLREVDPTIEWPKANNGLRLPVSLMEHTRL